MRLVNWTIRDVKQARLSIDRRLPLWHQPSRNLSLLQKADAGHDSPRRFYATTIASPVELVTPQGLPRSLQPLAPPSISRRDKVYVQDAASFGKWQWLLDKPGILAIETDFNRKGPARRWKKTLLVDQLDNHGDFELWSCLLQHLQRTEGDRGVHKLWRAFWGRKSLYQFRGLPDKIFWTTIVEAALRLEDEKFLNSVYLYAEFMNEVYNVKWPDLYATVVPYFLRTQQHEKAVKWHLRLVPNNYPGSLAFISMMQEFSTDRTLASSFTLQSLYIASPERRLYDAMVPYLYGRGQSGLARLWRSVCLVQDDGPRLYAPSRQFLRWLLGYFVKVDLHPREVAAVRNHAQSLPDVEEKQIEVSREFMNHVHGKTFGFTAKTYNDELGARWFASSWIGLDFATSVVAALGIQQIGPLSLQSICLREETAKGVLARIDSLEAAGVKIPSSGYAKTVQYFARTGDDELLTRLLQCDIHPDVFDDLDMQARLMASSAASGDLSTYTLLLASRLACVDDSARTTANTMLQIHIDQSNYSAVLHILDDIRAAGLPLDIKTCNMIFEWVRNNLEWHSKLIGKLELKFAVAVCQRLSSMDVPVPVSCWARITQALGRHGFLEDLNNLTFELLDYYTIRQSSRPGFVPINKVDVPSVLTEPLSGVSNLVGLYIPLDTPRSLPLHPLNQIFTHKWQTDLLRWSFRKLHERQEDRALFAIRPGHHDTHFERAVSVLRRLRERGVMVQIGNIRKALFIRLAELYGNTPAARKALQQSKQANVYSLTQAKTMIDEAWGSELLPPMAELTTEIQKFDEGYLRRYHEYTVANKQRWELAHPNQKFKQIQKERQRGIKGVL